MEAKSRFKVKLSNEAQEFLDGLPNKVREKIISNIRKSTFVLDPDLFKKLDDTDIWEFRTFYNKTKYRLLAFWDKDDAEYIAFCKQFSARWISLPVSPSAEQFSRVFFVLVDAMLKQIGRAHV